MSGLSNVLPLTKQEEPSPFLHPYVPVAKPQEISGLQKGPAERGHVKKRQKSSQSVKEFFDTFRQFSRRAKNVKNRQKVSKSFSTLFDNFRATPFFRPLWQSAEEILENRFSKFGGGGVVVGI